LILTIKITIICFHNQFLAILTFSGLLNNFKDVFLNYILDVKITYGKTVFCLKHYVAKHKGWKGFMSSKNLKECNG